MKTKYFLRNNGRADFKTELNRITRVLAIDDIDANITTNETEDYIEVTTDNEDAQILIRSYFN